MEFASSCSRSGSNTRRGWTGFGSISLIPICVGDSRAGCTASAAERFGSRAVSPFPKALRGASCGLFIGEYLLGQLDIAFRSPGADVVAQDWLTVAGGLGKADISRDDGAKDLIFEEGAQILGYLASKCRPVIE